MKLNLPDCGLPTCRQKCPDGIVICGDHAARMTALLDGLPEVVEALMTAEGNGLRFSSSGGSRGSGAGQRLPFNERAADARRFLEAGLSDAARWVAMMIGDDLGRVVSLDAVAQARYVGENFRVVRSSPDGVAQYEFLGQLIAGALRVVDRPADLMYLGECGEATEDMAVCDARLYAHQGMIEVTCVQCGWVHDVMSRRSGLLASAAEIALPPTELARAIASVGGIEVTPKRIQKWAEHGKLKAVGRAGGGRLPMYKVKDVMAVLEESAARRQELNEARVEREAAAAMALADADAQRLHAMTRATSPRATLQSAGSE